MEVIHIVNSTAVTAINKHGKSIMRLKGINKMKREKQSKINKLNLLVKIQHTIIRELLHAVTIKGILLPDHVLRTIEGLNMLSEKKENKEEEKDVTTI